MKFLVDVNASGIVVDWFLERGHDLAEVAEKDPSMGDERILQWAVREQRIIVTTDQDFEQRIWREGKDHRGILRLENLPRAERLALLADVMARHSEDLRAGAMVIALSQKIRIRKSPGENPPA